MNEPLTISKEAPLQKSMDYALLREEGLKYIQNVAGKVWTDYNTHDPGITILEVLCYALTDLGYRTSYDIKDLITLDPDKSDGEDIYNFFTAAEILPNAPVTTGDYRKLMIDVEVHEPADPGCEYAGIKNAWIEPAIKPEIDLYVDKAHSKLVYEPVLPNDEPLDLKILHNILLEFDRCETYGDLNENKLIDDLTIVEHTPDPELNGLVIRIDVEFPRWDNKEIDWNNENNTGIAKAIQGIQLSFLNLGDNFAIEYEVTPASQVMLTGTKTSASGPEPIDGLDEIAQAVNEFIYDPAEGLIVTYRQKIAKIMEIVDEVKARLHANRNLCEDFLQLNALRIEEILLCADIELEFDADVEETLARIYHEIAKFLSPTVYFYTLEEMMTRCFDRYRYDIVSIDTEQKVFTIGAVPEPFPEKETVISITGSNNNNGTYRIRDARPNRDDETRTDIFVEETIPSGILTEDEQLYLVNLEEEQCTPTEKIFEGPLLEHGFIDDEELANADRKKVIHVSDLIQIIMDVPGVVAVKNIQIANLPQDNEGGEIESKSVRWCLELAFDRNYVPRLNTDDSRITFYKDQLPFRADPLQVDEIINELEKQERTQKLRNPVMDIEPPAGEYKNIEEYYSIQNEFPLVYGIGEEGVPTRSTDNLNLPTEVHALQLKGFLMYFDQMLANYLSQLAHVKDLFSMNPQKDEFGDFVIGRTYYTQPLFDIVPDADALYIDKPGHEADLNTIAESEEGFRERRNRFLDHLMARFAEQFTDYALLMYRISGPKAQDELIEDKLAFLNGYPELSSRRGTALDYRDPCKLWHIDNVSGVERRASLLMGIEERKRPELKFSPRFKILGTEPDLTFSVENDVPEEVLKSVVTYETEEDAKEALERVVANGVHRHKYGIRKDGETDEYFFELLCDGTVLAESPVIAVTSEENAESEVGLAIDEVVALLTDEFFDNPESSRRNLTCPLGNYFSYTIDEGDVDMAADPPTYIIGYELYEKPFLFDSADLILSGSITGTGEPKRDVRILNIDTGTSTITVEGNILGNLWEEGVVVIEGSAGNDGAYTIDSFSLNGDDTDIVVTETIPSGAAPLGDLYYNTLSKGELLALAESTVHDLLWRVVANGVRRRGYSFDPAVPPYGSPYRFQIRDFRGAVLGTSEEADFNDPLAAEITGIGTGTVTVVPPGDEPEEQEYALSSASGEEPAAVGPHIEVTLESAPSPAPAFGWNLRIGDTFPLKGIDRDERHFIVEGDLSERLSDGDPVTIADHPSNDGEYTVRSVSFDGTDSTVQVEEPIPSEEEEEEGTLGYTKSFPVVKTEGRVITVKGGGDEAAVQEMMEFLQSKFFDHEGMHLVEHILLRPKTDEPLFVDADARTLQTGLADDGSLRFVKEYPLKSADSASRTFSVDGDITADLSNGMAIHIHDSPLSQEVFTVDSFSYASPATEIAVEEIIVADIVASSPEGTLSYEMEVSVSTVSAAGRKITIPGNVADTVSAGSIAEITGSTDGENDGRYRVESTADAGGDTEFVIDKVEDLVRDRLLAVNLDEDCECVLEDPYTCMAHVVLPYWPGRFTNMDFRRFFEKTLRREAPAHVYLTICWVSCSHMAAFERAWKAWLIEISRKPVDKVTLSNALGALIDSIEQLRNVYPKGTLHDCDEDENLENSIILNNSVLGEI